MFLKTLVKVAAFLALSLNIVSAQPMEVTGAGASLPYPIYAKWAAQYHADTGHKINYQSIGSGAGQQQIIAGTVAFGASDDPMSAQALEENNLLQFPAIIGGVVPVVNIEGIAPGALKFTPELLANIYLGTITHWDDPAITELNPELKLPHRPIIVIHRSDGSGTTFVWTHYLASVSEQWQDTVGIGKAVKWPTGQGGKGNEGVAAYVRQLNDSIGYVEFAYALQNDLSWVQLQNRAGLFVTPSEKSFAAAAAQADWENTPGMGVILTNVEGEQSWPITAASFILLQKEQQNPAQAKAVLSFFDWAFTHGAKQALELDYIPLPDTVIKQIHALWHQHLTDTMGRALW